MIHRISLPIDAFVDDIVTSLRRDNTLVIQASPGSGKTTRVPTAVHDACGRRGRVIVLEPRRLAARMAAHRVASEIGESCGRRVGYHIRFDKVYGKETEILFMTEGMLLRYLVADPELNGVCAVILDEFHERHLHTDVALALVRRLQASSRPDLRLVVMSATLDTDKLQTVLVDSPLIQVQVPPHNLTILHQPEATQSESVDIFSKRLYDRIASGIKVARESLRSAGVMPGHVLVFLPGAPEIARCAEFLERSGFAADHAILSLHGSLSPRDQQAVFASSPISKIILSTNIAESSLTIDGVNMVVDSGLAKVPSYSSWAGLPVLRLQRISQASSLQRAGRAARQGPGVVLRLYSESDFRGRPGHEQPEITRLDLTQTVLELSCIPSGGESQSVGQFSTGLPWVDPPDAKRFEAATDLLKFLGAIDADGCATEMGREMSRFPVHPRLARIVIEGMRRNLLAEACSFAALVSDEAQSGRTQRIDRVRAEEPAFRRGFEQIARTAGLPDTKPVLLPGDSTCVANVTPLVLAGYADRVARFESGETWRLVDGRTVAIRGRRGNRPGGVSVRSDSPHEPEHDWICLVDADVNPSDPGRILARAWYPLLIDTNGALLREIPELWRQGPVTWWDESGGGRVRSTERTSFGALVLREKSIPVDMSQATLILRQELKRAWPSPYASDDELQQWRNRILTYAASMGEEPIIDLDIDAKGGDFEFLLDVLVDGKVSFAEIGQRSISSGIEELIGYESVVKIQNACPVAIKIPSNREARIHYVHGQSPWIAGKIQEFFGWRNLPTLAGGRIPLVVHLLAPNQRPIQVTADLAGFWVNHYPGIRRALARDYPRHYWPEDPLTAEPKVLVKQRVNFRRD